ncbi:hypothetical protein AGR2A_Lc160067 [Agrobacterium genomosp. 2 str. CFBP 5494]|uniref:Uncharacterized protein n=1 Tax=Agrobacterium genomosp. 2 str. CFBP 5494 TaxID=1183436 RepID=A0A9W5B3E4_9HYPH|nr:hypothetical protein AGR2A_Lc160067 [Agrobacterium genomosp. 2 str. CFBP 5494]
MAVVRPCRTRRGDSQAASIHNLPGGENISGQVPLIERHLLSAEAGRAVGDRHPEWREEVSSTSSDETASRVACRLEQRSVLM